MTDLVRVITASGVLDSKSHYAHASAANGLLFVSGQLPDPAIGADSSFEDQVRSVMRQLLAVVAAGGSTPADLLKVNAYIVGIEHWPQCNAIYADLLGDIKPTNKIWHVCLIGAP